MYPLQREAMDNKDTMAWVIEVFNVAVCEQLNTT